MHVDNVDTRSYSWELEDNNCEARGELSDFYCHMPMKTKAYHNLFCGPPAVMSLDTIVDNPGMTTSRRRT
jgi:hypothetical protein